MQIGYIKYKEILSILDCIFSKRYKIYQEKFLVFAIKILLINMIVDNLLFEKVFQLNLIKDKD